MNLRIDSGKIIGIVGPDGAGKTTLLRLLMGLLKPSSGTILYNGINISKEPSYLKNRTGYMPQHFSLYGDLSVSENLRFFADLYGVPKVHYKSRKQELLRFSGLFPFEDRLARNLSGGMQKKLALACNLFHTPEILLLDEPTTGVDPISRKELWNLLGELNTQGTTIIITTPYMDEAQRCHVVGMIYEGRILSFKSPHKIIEEMDEEIIQVVVDISPAQKILIKMPELRNIYPFGSNLHLAFKAGENAEVKIQQLLKHHGLTPASIQKISPSFEDAFMALIQKKFKMRIGN
jgi:ABC-2 type transport system ATP-binding protein